jgi:hypothetical protein
MQFPSHIGSLLTLSGYSPQFSHVFESSHRHIRGFAIRDHIMEPCLVPRNACTCGGQCAEEISFSFSWVSSFLFMSHGICRCGSNMKKTWACTNDGRVKCTFIYACTMQATASRPPQRKPHPKKNNGIPWLRVLQHKWIAYERRRILSHTFFFEARRTRSICLLKPEEVPRAPIFLRMASNLSPTW